jgi:hypothetical protein
MSEIPYTNLPGKIPKYLLKIQETGVPSKVDSAFLKQCGFSSGNDGYILQVLKFIGFVDEAKAPTELWKAYKSPVNAKAVLASGIRKGYSDLFSLYPDANRKDKDTLYAYFSSKTGKAKNTVEYIVSTFVNLSQLADFDKEAPTTLTPNNLPASPLPTTSPSIPMHPTIVSSGKAIAPTEIHINIQLHLPPATDPTVFDNLFKSMKKHLLSAEN